MQYMFGPSNVLTTTSYYGTKCSTHVSCVSDVSQT